MKKSRIFGLAIIALVLLGISYLPSLFLENGDRLVWQLSNWAWIFASLLIAIIGILLTVRFTKGKYILLKIMGWLGCIVLVMACLFSFSFAMFIHDVKIWSCKDYAVYSEYDGVIDPNKFVLYKRDGLIDRRMYRLGNIDFDDLKGADYSMYKDYDLIKEEIDAVGFYSDSAYHRTIFYRLSDGVSFEQEKNDSLLEVIKH